MSGESGNWGEGKGEEQRASACSFQDLETGREPCEAQCGCQVLEAQGKGYQRRKSPELNVQSSQRASVEETGLATRRSP